MNEDNFLVDPMVNFHVRKLVSLITSYEFNKADSLGFRQRPIVPVHPIKNPTPPAEP